MEFIEGDLDATADAVIAAAKDGRLSELLVTLRTARDSDAPQHSGNFVTTRNSSGVYQTRELAPGTSYRQSVGGGDYGGRIATPAPRTALDRKAYNQR